MSLGVTLQEGQPAPGTAYYVYGVVLAEDRRVPPRLRGIDDQPVRTIAWEGMAAVVSEFALDRPAGRRAEVIAHSNVLNTLAQSGAVVPLQFGSVLPDASLVAEELLARQEGTLRELLEHLDGRVQFNLRATYVEEVALSEVVTSDPEIATLRRRTREAPEDSMHAERLRLGELVAAAMEAKRAADSAALLEALHPYVETYRERGGAGIEHLLDVALLVDQERSADLEDRLETLAEAGHERMRLRLVGPVAPYDFVGEL